MMSTSSVTRARSSFGTRALLAAGLLALTGCGEPAGSQQSGRTQAATIPPSAQVNATTMQQDLANRATDVQWPAGFAPEQAELFAHNEIRIAASCERTWGHLVRAVEWPQWYPNAQGVGLVNGGAELGPGARFRWSTFGVPLESRVAEFEPNRRLAWYGYAVGEPPAFYHAFDLRPNGDGCSVVTEEVGIGPAGAAFRQADEGRMHRGHRLWLETLAWRSAEAR